MIIQFHNLKYQILLQHRTQYRCNQLIIIDVIIKLFVGHHA